MSESDMLSKLIYAEADRASRVFEEFAPLLRLFLYISIGLSVAAWVERKKREIDTYADWL